MAKLYRQKVSEIAQALEHPDTRTEAAEAIRGLLDEIVLTPDTHPSDVKYRRALDEADRGHRGDDTCELEARRGQE